MSTTTKPQAKRESLVATAARTLLGSPATASVSGEEFYLDDVARLDVQMPGWDEPARVAGARRRLSTGMPVDKVQAIYGRRTVELAQQGLAPPHRVAAG